MYVCPYCGKKSYENGGRPVCCHCGKSAPKDETPREEVRRELLPEVEREIERRREPAP